MDLDDALADLVTRCGDRLLRVAYQLTHDRAAAQDLVQDALLRVYGSLSRRGVEPADYYAYLRRAVVNEYTRTRRLRASSEIVTDTLPDRPDGEPPEEPDRRPRAVVACARGAEPAAARRAGVALLRGSGRPRDRGCARLPRRDRAQPRQPRPGRPARAHRAGRSEPGEHDMSDRPAGDLASDLARVMRAQDAEAPSAAGLLAALRDAPAPAREPAWSRGRRRFVPLAAAAAVAVVIAGSIWAGTLLTHPTVMPGLRVVRGTPLSCPARYDRPAPWVPARSSGMPARGRLVPRRAPRSAVICGYDGRNVGRLGGWRLSGRRLLHGGLAGLAADLAWEPKKVHGQQIACFTMGGPQVNYLIGLTYQGGGRLWVSATQDPNECVPSSNGEFTSFGVVGGLVTEAFKSGRWPAASRLPATGVAARAAVGSARTGRWCRPARSRCRSAAAMAVRRLPPVMPAWWRRLMPCRPGRRTSHARCRHTVPGIGTSSCSITGRGPPSWSRCSGGACRRSTTRACRR